MRRLSLVRHGKSSWKSQRLADIERPLSARGKRDAPVMGARMRARRARPSLILSSPAERASATAKLIADALAYPREFIQTEPRLYMADSAALRETVAQLDDRYADVMLVAHNPGLTDFVNRLLPALDLDNLPTSGVVALDIAAEHWLDFDRHDIRLAYFDYPKNPAPAA